PPPEPTRRAPAPPNHRPPTTPESLFGQQPDGPSAAPGATPLTPPDALTQRARGAQLPRTSVISLHGRRGGDRPATTAADPSAPPSGPSGHPPLTPGASKATDVQTLLANFTAGVQRGLFDARAGGGPRTPH
ncbi:MAG: hypothetical protein PV358_07545, partial [Acidimicrobiales bacterium]|nr:hypothetical protein [Acidimicrobiales bacterium]